MTKSQWTIRGLQNTKKGTQSPNFQEQGDLRSAQSARLSAGGEGAEAIWAMPKCLQYDFKWCFP